MASHPTILPGEWGPVRSVVSPAAAGCAAPAGPGTPGPGCSRAQRGSWRPQSGRTSRR